MTALEQLGSYVAQVGREEVSDDVREAVELHLIDSVGAWVAGRATIEASGPESEPREPPLDDPWFDPHAYAVIAAKPTTKATLSLRISTSSA